MNRMRLFGNVMRKKMAVHAVLACIVAGMVTAVPANAAADPSAGVVEMLKTAAAANDKATFDTLLETALKTWPKKRVALLKSARTISETWMSQGYLDELAAAKAAQEAAEAASRARGIMYYLDPTLWDGQAQLGASTSSGDSDEQGVSAALSFERAFGPKWNHSLNFKFDFGRSEGVTTRQRFVGQYEVMWKPWKDAFLLNFTELELDKFSGFDYRVVENIAIGTQVFRSANQSLRVEGGPGIRISGVEETLEDGLLVPAHTNKEFLGRVSSTYELKLTDNLTFRDRASAIFGTESTTLENWAQFSARINSHMQARLSFEVKYDSLAPIGTAAWDTATRATLVYDF
jgi:putative salt-induced outer membrane protein